MTRPPWDQDSDEERKELAALEDAEDDAKTQDTLLGSLMAQQADGRIRLGCRPSATNLQLDPKDTQNR